MDPAIRLQPYLRPDESLLWCGQPDPRVLLAGSDLFAIPFGLFWTGSVVYYGIRTGNGGLSVQWGFVPFLAVGIYVLVGRYVMRYVRKKRTAYGITTTRGLVAGPRSLTDIPLRSRAVRVQRSRDSRHASVLIGDQGQARYASSGPEFFDRSGRVPTGFWDVADPDAMLLALEQARTQPPAPTPQ